MIAGRGSWSMKIIESGNLNAGRDEEQGSNVGAGESVRLLNIEKLIQRRAAVELRV